MGVALKEINSIKQKIKIVGVAEALRMSPDELSGWNILSIRGRMAQEPLTFPGARKTLSLHFDDVHEDRPEADQFAAAPADIEAALEFARSIGNESLIIHCTAGVSRSTAIAWLIVYDKLKAQPDAVRRSFNIVRKLRPILAPNGHILNLGLKALIADSGNREVVAQQFNECLAELKQ